MVIADEAMEMSKNGSFSETRRSQFVRSIRWKGQMSNKSNPAGSVTSMGFANNAHANKNNATVYAAFEFLRAKPRYACRESRPKNRQSTFLRSVAQATDSTL